MILYNRVSEPGLQLIHIMDSSHSQIFNIYYFSYALINISINKINGLCKYLLLPSIKQITSSVVTE